MSAKNRRKKEQENEKPVVGRSETIVLSLVARKYRGIDRVEVALSFLHYRLRILARARTVSNWTTAISHARANNFDPLHGDPDRRLFRKKVWNRIR